MKFRWIHIILELRRQRAEWGERQRQRDEQEREIKRAKKRERETESEKRSRAHIIEMITDKQITSMVSLHYSDASKDYQIYLWMDIKSTWFISDLDKQDITKVNYKIVQTIWAQDV